ncbi:MAG: hypothetical protein JJT89_03940 [Nitriliruptoraceae bacterium]|nr:hypothetical protein [Nitriliruptoraceae bacterium]
MGAVQITLGLYATVLPAMLAVAWLALAVADLRRRDDLATGARAGWAAVVVLLPGVGPAGYLLGVARLARPRAAAIVVGGVVAYLLVLLATVLVGGTR